MWRLGIALALTLVGCARETGNLGPGMACVRSLQCEPGLACVAGQCSGDLSGLEGGTLPPRPVDAGPLVDAGPIVDAGPPVDAGPIIDAGMDAGMTVDGGMMLDAGMDAGPPPVDAGMDAGMDAGPFDAGP